MNTITIKGREIPLIYTVLEMKTIQEEIAPLGRLQYIVYGLNPDDENDTSGFGLPQHLDAAAKLIRILGNAGLEEAGEEPDLTDRKVMRALKPAELFDAVKICAKAMGEGMESEIPDTQKKSGPVDVVLEEIERKKEKADSLT